MRNPESISLARIVKCAVSLLVYLATRAREILVRMAGQTPDAKCVVLYYHSVPPQQRKQFSRQLDTILRHARPVALREEPALTPGVNYLALSFDDALQNLLEHALPELITRNIPATIFVISGAMGKTFGVPHALEQVMTPQGLQALPDNLITIGSHTVTHPFLPSLPRDAALWELQQSRTDLARLLNRDVSLFSFPFGGYTEQLIDLCRELGYQRVFTTQPALAFTTPSEFAVGRIRVDPTDWPLEFFLKIAGAYRWLPWAFRLKRRLRSGSVLRSPSPRNRELSEMTVPKATIQ